jgi:UDP-3-O-[3-hydroxymyristoyl] glucosamine N-acyltransferase
VSIGNHVVIGQASAIYSYQIEDDKVLVASVSIEDEVILGPQVVVFPGTIIKQGATLDGGTFNHPFSEYQADTIYHGAPAKPWHPEDSGVLDTDATRKPEKK